MEENEDLAKAAQRIALHLEHNSDISRDQRFSKPKEQAVLRPSVFAEKQKRNRRRQRALRGQQLIKLTRKSAYNCRVPTFDGFAEPSEDDVQ